MNNLLKLWTAIIKDACSKYADTHGILIDQQDGFRQHRSIHDALSSIIMMMEGAKTHNKDIYVMHADFRGAFNAVDHRIMFKHMRQLGMPPTFVDTCEHLYGVSSTAYITPYGPTPSIDINRGTMQGDTLSPFLKLEIVYNMYRQTGPTPVSRATLLRHKGLISKFGPGLFDKVHLSTHLSAMCVDVPRELKNCKQPQ
jgi:hypothetical protein